MTVKELKAYLENFENSDEIAVGAWFADGRRFYLPHKPCCDPIIERRENKRYAVIGIFDDCRAHCLSRQ